MTNQTLESWNFQVLMLNQSLIGAISSNFRMITLARDKDEWVLGFYLEKESEEDIDEIDEIVCQYTGYQDCFLKCRSNINIGSGKLEPPPELYRIVYKRKEQ